MAQGIQPVDINEQVTVKESGAVKNSPDEEKDVVLVKTLLEKGKKHRKDYDKNWDKYDAYYCGNQWYGKERPKYRASPSANIIRPTIQTILPIMTDTQPGIEVVPEEPNDYSFADILGEVARSWWDRSGMAVTITEALTDCLKLDIGILKVVWNPDLEHGAGDIEVVVVDPRNIYVPDGATDFTKNCPWVLEMYPAQVGELKRQHPDKAEFIKPTGKRHVKSTQSDTGEINLVSPVDKDMMLNQPETTGMSTDTDVAWVAELWIDDYAVEDVEDEAHPGETTQRRKWPNGKIIQCIPDLGLHLKTDGSPYKDGWKPYVRFVDTLRPREFYAEGEIGPLIEAQDLINKSLAIVYDYLTYMTNPTWIVDFESGVDPDSLTNQIGLVVPKKAGTEVRREAPPPMPPRVMDLYKLATELANTQSGVHDVTQGRKPVGVTAAEAINTMQEAAQTRIRLKERNMQSSLRRLGLMVISRILQFYTAPRVIKISGAEGWPEFFEFYVENTDTGGYKWHKQRWIREHPDSKQYVRANREEAGESKGIFDVEVVAGTALPFMKAQRGELALRLFREKVIDRQNVLDMLEWPNKEEVLRRVNEEEAAMIAAQQQAAGGGQPQMGR